LIAVIVYDSFTYNLVQYLGTLGATIEVYRNDAITVDAPGGQAARWLVIPPGPGEPRDAGISEQAILALAGKVPILGVCLGHQGLGEAYGGKVVRAQRLMHGKTSPILHKGRGLFAGIDNPFEATRYHSLIVERESLPPVLEIMAGRRRARSWRSSTRSTRPGASFHPESVLTRSGSS
jgi:anthranilate synthase/aminodeoxychorismate synthase-like glutamine amidotransferase